MARYIVQRLGHAAILLFLLSLLVFGLLKLMPGDYLTEMEMNPSVSPELVRNLREQYGLDRPVHLQYFSWLTSMARGDWGFSFAQQRPAAQLILERMINTLFLGGTAFVFSLLLTFPLGVLAARRPGGPLDRVTLGLSLLGLSLPPLLLSLAGVLLAFKTRWFPIGGLGGFRHVILPAAILAIPVTAYLVRQLRLEMIETWKRPYVAAAWARGLNPIRVGLHALRGALNPMISLLGITWAGLLTGSVVIEKVFDWPGLGLLMVDSIGTRDLFVVLNGVLLSAVVVIASNFVADLLLAWNDPRLRER